MKLWGPNCQDWGPGKTSGAAHREERCKDSQGPEGWTRDSHACTVISGFYPSNLDLNECQWFKSKDQTRPTIKETTASPPKQKQEKNLMWGLYTPIVPVSGKPRQEDHEFRGHPGLQQRSCLTTKPEKTYHTAFNYLSLLTMAHLFTCVY